jgi:hypothetical protein
VISIKRQQFKLEWCIFPIFSQASHCSLHAFEAALIPLPKGSGELIFSDGPHDTYPACPEAILGQQEASQFGLHSWKKKKVHWGNIQ